MGLLGAAEAPANKDGADAPRLEFSMGSESLVELDGTATVGSWTTRSADVQGNVILRLVKSELDAVFDRVQKTPPRDKADAHEPDLTVHSTGPATARLSVSVMSLKSHSKGMDSDLHDALKAKEHPEIEYVFEKVEKAGVERDPKDHPFLKLRILGSLTMAGAKRDVPMDLSVQLISPGVFRVNARTSLLMSDFGVVPSPKLFGLIHVHDQVVVSFDLSLHLTDPPPAAPSQP